MKVIINPNQLKLLERNFHLIEGKGLIQNGKNLINESRLKEYLVKIFIQGMPAEIRIGANNSGSALKIARKLFPSATVTAMIKSL